MTDASEAIWKIPIIRVWAWLLAECYLLTHKAGSLKASAALESWREPTLIQLQKRFISCGHRKTSSARGGRPYNRSFLVSECFSWSRSCFLAFLLNQAVRTNFMSPLNPVNLTYFEEKKMGASVKAVTFHSPSDSLSGGIQLYHIPFTGMDI